MPQRAGGGHGGDSVRPLYAAKPAENRSGTATGAATGAAAGNPAGSQAGNLAGSQAGNPAGYQPAAHAAAAHPAQLAHPARPSRPAQQAQPARPAQPAYPTVISLAQQLAARPTPLRPSRWAAATADDSTSGPLLVIGGAEQMSPPSDSILARFVDLAGGAAGHIVVIATASTDPQCREVEYQRVFTRLGSGRVTPLRLTDRDQASSPEAAAAIMTATGVFFTGGDQVRITTILGGSKVDCLLHSRVAEGMALAGTSAGAAMMSGTMIVGGSDAKVSTTSVRTAPGLEFLPGVLIDMHFATRGRLNRLLSAVALYPHELGLGIDEDTAILVSGGRFEVLGSGSVTVIDAGPAARIGTPADGDGPIAVHGMQLHVLPAGHLFHLTGRRPLPPGVHTEGT